MPPRHEKSVTETRVDSVAYQRQRNFADMELLLRPSGRGLGRRRLSIVLRPSQV